MKIFYKTKNGSIRCFDADKDTRKNRVYNKDTHYICKLPFKERIEKVYGKIKNDDVVITDERILHIVERRDENSSNKIMDELRNVIKGCDAIYDDPNDSGKSGIMVVKNINDYKTIIIILALSTAHSEYANSVITGIIVGDKSIKRMVAKRKKIV